MAEAAPGGSPSPAQKSSSPPEKSASSAAQKAPAPAGTAKTGAAPGAKAGGAGPAAQQPGAFKLIRNQPQPEGGSAGTLMGVAGFLALIAIAGMVFLGKGDETKTGDGPDGTGQTPTGPEGPAPTPVPDFVLDPIEFYENEGKLKDALAKAEEAQKDYPNAPELQAKIKSLRQRLGLEEGTSAPTDVAPLLAEARRLMGAGELDKALEAIDKALEVNPESAQALFTKGEILALQGDKLGAQGAFEAARGAGMEDGPVDEAISRLR